MNKLNVLGTMVRTHQRYELYSMNDLHVASGGAARHHPSKWKGLERSTGFDAQFEWECTSPEPVICGDSRPGDFVIEAMAYNYAIWISPEFHIAVVDAIDCQQRARAVKTLLEDEGGFKFEVHHV